MKKYYYECQQIDENILQVESNCSGLMFINQNLFAVYVNGFSLASGGTLVLDPQNSDDIDTTVYRIGWGSNTGTLSIFKRIYLK